MDSKQFRMLQLLDGQILSCMKCQLFSGGRAKPFYSPQSRYAIWGEAPGRDEVYQNSPFVGPAGKILWEVMLRYGFSRDDFLIINSVNCRPVVAGKNGKPNGEQMTLCRIWVRKYLHVLQPEKVILFGSFAVASVYGDCNGIINMNGKILWNDEFGFHTITSVHPAYVIYNEEKGKNLLEESIKKFKEMT